MCDHQVIGQIGAENNEIACDSQSHGMTNTGNMMFHDGIDAASSTPSPVHRGVE